MKVVLDIPSNDVCKQNMDSEEDPIKPSQICVIAKGKDTCQGDR
jgi:hypothetical protein